MYIYIYLERERARADHVALGGHIPPFRTPVRTKIFQSTVGFSQLLLDRRDGGNTSPPSPIKKQLTESNG